MIKISDRIEKFVTVELSENDLRTLALAISLTNGKERKHEADSFYGFKGFVDTGDNLFDSLVELLGVEEKFEPEIKGNAKIHYGTSSVLL